MRIRCFLLGCRWESGVLCTLGGERIRWQLCMRCGAHRWVSA